jgi:hypothetical protein
MNQKQKDTIREEFYNSYRLAVKNGGIHDQSTLDEFSDWWLLKLDQAYQQGAKDKMEEVREQYKSDIEQLKLVHQLELQAISCKSLEDFVRWSEHSRQSLKDNT